MQHGRCIFNHVPILRTEQNCLRYRLPISSASPSEHILGWVICRLSIRFATRWTSLFYDRTRRCPRIGHCFIFRGVYHRLIRAAVKVYNLCIAQRWNVFLHTRELRYHWLALWTKLSRPNMLPSPTCSSSSLNARPVSGQLLQAEHTFARDIFSRGCSQFKLRIAVVQEAALLLSMQTRVCRNRLPASPGMNFSLSQELPDHTPFLGTKQVSKARAY